MSRSDNICGAITWVIMVMGIKYGKTESNDPAARDKACTVANVFLTEFLHRGHAIRCTGLFGFNLSESRGLARVQENDFLRTKCTRCVRDAAEILEKVL